MRDWRASVATANRDPRSAAPKVHHAREPHGHECARPPCASRARATNDDELGVAIPTSRGRLERGQRDELGAFAKAIRMGKLRCDKVRAWFSSSVLSVGLLDATAGGRRRTFARKMGCANDWVTLGRRLGTALRPSSLGIRFEGGNNRPKAREPSLTPPGSHPWAGNPEGDRVMCMRTTCESCKKPSYAGCGRHVDQVLGNVPVRDRCHCREEQQEPENESKQGPSFMEGLFG